MKLKDIPEGGVFRAENDLVPQVKLRQCKRLVIVGSIMSETLNLLDGEQEIIGVDFVFDIGAFFDVEEIDKMEAKVRETERKSEEESV